MRKKFFGIKRKRSNQLTISSMIIAKSNLKEIYKTNKGNKIIKIKKLLRRGALRLESRTSI
jgi:hypothetical protein